MRREITNGPPMRSPELRRAVAARAGLSNRQAEAAIDAFSDVLRECLVARRRLVLLNVGAFSVRRRGARRGVALRTLEPIEYPETVSVAFAPTDTLTAAARAGRDD